MHIKVTGNAAVLLRNTLIEAGLAVVESYPTYTVCLDAASNITCPIIDGVDCELERLMVNRIAELTPSGRILLKRGGGVQSDREVRIVVPSKDDEVSLATIGIMRAMIQYRDRNQPKRRLQWTSWKLKLCRWSQMLLRRKT